MSTTTTGISPAETVERALAAARSDDCVVIAEETSAANLRWAGNTLTTNGVSRSRRLTVIAIDRRGDGAAAGVVSRSGVRPDQIEDVVREAEHAAAEAAPAEDAGELIGAGQPGSFGGNEETGEVAGSGQAGSFGQKMENPAGTHRLATPKSASCATSPPRSGRRFAPPGRPGASCTDSPSTS